MKVERKMLEAVADLRDLCREFMNKKLIQWPLPIEAQLQAHPVFAGEAGAKHWKTLRKRVVQHNIRICSIYYTRATSGRGVGRLVGFLIFYFA